MVKVNLNFYDVTAWLTNYFNTHIAQYHKNCGGEISSRPFSEKLKLSISLNQQSKALYSLFFCMPSSGLSKYIGAKLQTTCFHLLLSFF